MANTRELRRRIKSVKNTSQITRAMEMVAAVKMKKAQDQAVNGRPYSDNLSSALERLLPRVDLEAHPLLTGNGSTKVGIILLTTDKGLVGALNTNLVRTVISAKLQNVIFYTVGKKGRSFVVRTEKQLVADFENVDAISFRQAVQLSKIVIEAFRLLEVGEVILIYPQFISTLRQEPNIVKLLPISLPLTTSDTSEFLFEPNIDTLLDALLIHHIQIKIYQALLETKASEHSSRMVAMKNATDNAKELVSDLTLNYNQARQDSITKEILEIATASVAMQ